MNGSVVSLECARVENGKDDALGGSLAIMGAKRRVSEEEYTAGVDNSSGFGDSGSTSGGEFPYMNATGVLGMNENWSQTGYKSTVAGMCLYWLVILTHVIIQLLLLFLTIEYYVQQGVINNLGDPIFLDEIQVLFLFEIVWTVRYCYDSLLLCS